MITRVLSELIKGASGEAPLEMRESRTQRDLVLMFTKRRQRKTMTEEGGGSISSLRPGVHVSK